MATKEECYNFGRRKGKAIIGVETTITTTNGGTTTASGTGAKLVELAKSKHGCKYVCGATGPNTFDCSGLTSWCHKQLGINIPRTSLAQSKSGKAVSKSNLQPGDLIFWKTTSAPVGHVGIYVGNNQFIHAPNKSKPVKYDNLDNYINDYKDNSFYSIDKVSSNNTLVDSDNISLIFNYNNNHNKLNKIEFNQDIPLENIVNIILFNLYN